MNDIALAGGVRILVVASARQLQTQITASIGNDGYCVRIARDWRAAKAQIHKWRPSLVLVDDSVWNRMKDPEANLMRPTQFSAMQLLRVARGAGGDWSSIRASASGLPLRPELMSSRELRVRIEIALRKADANGKDAIELHGLCIDDSSHRVTAAGRPVTLGPMEYRLLHFLMSHPDEMFTRSQLLVRTTLGGHRAKERVIDVRIRRLRKALEPHGLAHMVQTIHCLGYRFSSHRN